MIDDTDKGRRRMVVEEISNTPIEDSGPIEEVKEKVEELQGITEHISDDIKESAQVQEEIVEAAEKVEPTPQSPMPAPTYTEQDYYPRRSLGVNPLVIIVPGVLLLGALLGGIVFYQKGINQQAEVTPTPTDNPITAVAPTATPVAATIDLTKFTVNIFNGSGIAGEAGKAKTLLTTAGFKVGTTANAATYDFTKTIIKAKATVDPVFVTKLSSTLSKNYVVDAAQTLPTTAKDDVEVTIGSSKAN